MNSKSYTRIQGTDGIRRDVLPSTHPSLAGYDAIRAFTEKGVMTEQFFLGYAYTYGKMIREGFDDIPVIVVGWDPRDPEGLFTDAVIAGLRKANCDVLVAGRVPTPAVPMYIMTKTLQGGLMITASHNPPAQNGIKIFIPPAGIKPLPEDDVALSDAVMALDFDAVLSMPEIGDVTDVSDEVQQMFIEFHTDPKNSWLSPASLNNVITVVDPARGSYTSLARRIIREFVGDVSSINADAGDGKVNYRSGVADLEGVSRIYVEYCVNSNADLSPLGLSVKNKRSCNEEDDYTAKDWSAYPALSRMAELAASAEDDLVMGRKFLFGLVFDSDGDRFFLLVYDPFRRDIAVLTGDECAMLQADYLAATYPESIGGLFINTVESDLAVSDAAARLGFTPLLKPVGDKWILLEAVNCLTAKTGDATANENSETLAAKPLTKQTKTALDKYEYNAKGFIGTPLGFAVGCEETGHAITFGALTTESGVLPFAAGNGLKSALNTLAGVMRLAKNFQTRNSPSALQEFYSAIIDPFPRGRKRNLYVYFSRKEKLLPENSYSGELRIAIQNSLSQIFPGLELRDKTFPQEPELIYVSGHQTNGRQVLGVFARNSGTEDKSCLYIRTVPEIGHFVAEIERSLYPNFYNAMKRTDNPNAQVEMNFLRSKYDDKTPPKLDEEMQMIIGDKQGLLTPDGKLSELGRLVCEGMM